MTSGAGTRSVDLAIGGMTCASCAARVEKKLNRLDGVIASVNFATERAHVIAPPTVSVADLVHTVERTGYTAAPATAATDDDQAGSLRTRLLVSAVLTVPVLVLSMSPPLQFRYWQWIVLALAAPVALWGAWPFHRAAWTNLRHRATTMDTLVSLGVLAAFGWSLWALFLGDAGEPGMRMHLSFVASGADEIYLEVVAAVTTFLLAGRYAEARAKRRSGAALRALLDLGAKDVAVLRGDAEVRVPIGEVAVGDRFVVRPGEKVATDGEVVDGSSAIDASLVTGESVPVEVEPGDTVVGATVNAGGRLIVRATRIGADTQLAQMARLVETAQQGKAQVQRLADRVSAVFVPAVLVLAALTFAGWLLTGASAHDAFTPAVAVLIIACPCALGLATPTALMVGTGRGAQLGILIKGPEILESTRRVDTVVLDKTGTVTSGVMALHGVVADDPDDVLRLAGALEAASEHPVAKAIVAGARDRSLQLSEVAQFVALPGEGVQGRVDGRAVVVGRRSLLAQHGLTPDDRLSAALHEAEAAGRTPVLVAFDGVVRGVVDVGDTVPTSSVEAVRELRALGLRPVLLTGDNERAARAVAAQVGIDEVLAEVLPADKVDEVKRLQDTGRVVAMVGDGVNDAAALATADLGIAMGSGTDVAIEASDLTLLRSDLRAAPTAIRLSRATLRTIKGNLVWAFGYNVAALPLAAAGLLNPLIAGAAMAASSVFVVTNSLRLRRFR
jgi:Cu+-exporting ATPase